ncbi:type I restriction-modification system methyltransferase subunit [Vibrio sp. MEBiC08052]|nr:type I restriction-modification system methyltransferase subunit [Vibrio sp. MEBiC08052]
MITDLGKEALNSGEEINNQYLKRFDDFNAFTKQKNGDSDKVEDTSVSNSEATPEGPNGRWREYSYDEIISRDKTNLDITRLKGESLEDTENLQPPAVIVSEIVELLTAALEEFKSVEEALVEEED